MDTNPEFQPIESTPPQWAGDYLSRETVMPVPVKLNPALFMAVDGAKVVVGAAGALANAVSIPLKTTLKNKIPAQTTLVFNAGTKKFATLSAEAPAGAASLTVYAIPTALVEDDTATYQGVGKKSLPSGTFIGRTFAERDAGDAWGPATVASDDEQFLTTRDLSDLTVDNTTEIYRHNKVVKENYLPGWADKPTAEKTKIRSLYSCIGGKD